MKTFYLVIIFMSFQVCGQEFSAEDKIIFNTKLQNFSPEKVKSLCAGDLLAEVGKSFIGTPYVGHTLEAEGTEHLVINLRELDCTTFLESATAMTLALKSGKRSFEDFCAELANLRYRGGQIDRYPSRLHYFSDWIFDNSMKGVVSVVSDSSNAQEIRFPVDFMSKHPSSYKHLSLNPSFIPEIAKQEKNIARRTYYYFPKENVPAVDGLIRNGDLIAITSNVSGLDINHVGIAVKNGNNPAQFLHASLTDGKVILTEKSLYEYLSSVKRHTGIIVLRIEDSPEKQ